MGNCQGIASQVSLEEALASVFAGACSCKLTKAVGDGKVNGLRSPKRQVPKQSIKATQNHRLLMSSFLLFPAAFAVVLPAGVLPPPYHGTLSSIDPPWIPKQQRGQ